MPFCPDLSTVSVDESVLEWQLRASLLFQLKNFIIFFSLWTLAKKRVARVSYDSRLNQTRNGNLTVLAEFGSWQGFRTAYVVIH